MQVLVSGLQPQFFVEHLVHHDIGLPNVFFSVSELPYDVSSVSKTRRQKSGNNGDQKVTSSAVYETFTLYNNLTLKRAT